MSFNEFKKRFQQHFDKLIQYADHLFEIEVDKDEFWNLYLDSFPAGSNKIYRERREFDCSCCRQFMRTIGNVAVIRDNTVHTLWEFDTGDPVYQPVVDALNAYLLARPVTNLYVTKTANIGTDRNYESINGNVHAWEHFYLELPPRFVFHGIRSEEELKGEARSTRNVFKRSLDEITIAAVDAVLELIAQNSLYKGEEWESQLTVFKQYKEVYDSLPDGQKDNFAWKQSMEAGPVVGRIRNHSIGTLLVNLSEDMDLDQAVRKYELIVAPENYKRPKAIVTKRMLEDARKTVTELGYLNSLKRRFATLDDITVNNILFSNKDVAKRISGATVFDELGNALPVQSKKFSKVQEIGIEPFIQNVLPTASEVEVLLENKHTSNMVSLIAPENNSAPTMFKWNNGFSWAYSGNLADSALKANVKAAGGKVDGVLRFSIQWNDVELDRNDLDAHCKTPCDHIYYANKQEQNGRRILGELDVDIINPINGQPAVENITWSNTDQLLRGEYVFYVHCYSSRGGRSGFRAEIECGGTVYTYDYRQPLRQNENVVVAVVSYDPDLGFSIREQLPPNVASREIWGLQTGQFVPATVICLSPNYWDEQQGVGHKHYFFMLKGCVNPERPNGMFNEYLQEQLMRHKRVFEVLGNKLAVEDNPDQLSGLGFSSTKRAELIVKVKGATDRVLKIKF